MPNFDILSILPEWSRLKVIDIGAMALEGQADPYLKLIETGLATIIGFEPVQAEYEKLKATADRHHVYLPYAIGDGRRRTLNICNYSMTSSLYEPNTDLVDRFQNLGSAMKVVRREELDTKRLDDIPEVAGTDLLKMDVQGAEADVLNGATQLLAETLVIQVEVEFVPLYKDQPLFSDIDLLLRRHGFLIHKFLDISGRAFKPVMVNNDLNHPLSQILWSDAVYVRDFTAFASLRPEQLLKIAVILHCLYESPDLVIHALGAYDAQKGTTTAKTYLERLTGSG